MRPLLVLLFVPALLSGCAGGADLTRIEARYAPRGALAEQQLDPVIWIPGILGSQLALEDGETVWGGADRLGINPAEPEAARILAVPFVNETGPVRAERGPVRSTRSLRRVRPNLLGVTLERGVYGPAIQALSAGGYDFGQQDQISSVTAGRPLGFEFHYDWRRDIVESAEQLGAFIAQKKAAIETARRAEFGDRAKPVKFDIVTHSMGALVARYYLRYGTAALPADGSLPEVTWAGARHIGKLIYVAPPNSGSVNSLVALFDGRDFGPLQPKFDPVVMGTYISVFQMMPRQRHKTMRLADSGQIPDLYDVRTWDRLGLGILDPARDPALENLMPGLPDATARRARARRHVERVLAYTQAFHRALDRPAQPPPGLQTVLIMGDGYETPSHLAFDPETRVLAIVGDGKGDRRVLHASSLLDERQDGNQTGHLRSPLDFDAVVTLPEEHLEIVKSHAFADRMLYWLRQRPDQTRLAVVN